MRERASKRREWREADWEETATGEGGRQAGRAGEAEAERATEEERATQSAKHDPANRVRFRSVQ